MKSKPSRERPPGTGWAGKAAKHAAGSMTRRSALCRLGYAAAAMLGANFLVADGPKARATVVANPPCQFNQQKRCSPDGDLCGLQTGASLCNPLAACPGCLQANGCPQGTSPSGSWVLCCQCANNNNQGILMTYTDCCGKLDTTGPCGGNCPAPHVACGKLPRDPCYFTSLGADWCEVTNPSYACTTYSADGKCTPGNKGSCND